MATPDDIRGRRASLLHHWTSAPLTGGMCRNSLSKPALLSCSVCHVVSGSGRRVGDAVACCRVQHLQAVRVTMKLPHSQPLPLAIIQCRASGDAERV